MHSPHLESTHTAVRASGKGSPYSGDTYEYSLPGGFAKPLVPQERRAVRTAQVVDAAVADGQRTLVVTDVACDLPSIWLAEKKVLVLPMKLRFDSRSRSDTGEAAAAIEFFNRDLASVDSNVQALPLSASGTEEFIAAELRAETDFVLNVSLASNRGNGYMNALTAAQNLMLQHGRARRAEGITRPFKMWVIDSITAFNGQGVLVSDTVRALAAGTSVSRVVQQLDLLRKNIHTLVVPHHAAFFHQHNHVDSEPGLGWLAAGLTAGVSRVLDRIPVVHLHGATRAVLMQARSVDAGMQRAMESATRAVHDGLLAPCVCVSYAGELADLENLGAFTALQDACRQHEVTMQVAVMSMTNAIRLGAKAFAVALASESFVG